RLSCLRLSRSRDPTCLRSFPTRRSSDLYLVAVQGTACAFCFSDGYLAVYSGVAGGTRRFVSPVKSGGGRILSVGAGLLLHLLLFLLYPDYIYLRRILVFDRFCMGIPQKASHFAAGFTLSLRQMRAETEGEGSLPTLRSRSEEHTSE